MSLKRWAYAFLNMGGIMVAIGLLPVLIVGTFLPGLNSVLPGMMFFLVTPIGAIILLAGIIMWLAAIIRR